MSKYYKAEDVIRAIAEQLCWIARTEYGDKFTTEDWLEEAEDYVSDLPTIEVSEDFVKDTDVPINEDCISREQAIEAIDGVDWYHVNPVGELVHGATSEGEAWYRAEDIYKAIESVAPSVVPSRAEGEWVLECDAEGEGDNLYRCPECGQRCGCQEYDLPNYCGNCGAKMKGADDVL